MSSLFARTAISALVILLLSINRMTTAASALAQTQPTYDPLQEFVGTWTAITRGQSSPYLSLQFKEGDGKLTGTTTHFKMKVIARGEISGSPEPGESPLLDLKVSGGDLGFVWEGESHMQTVRAKFVLQGTQRALLVLVLPAETVTKIMKENPGAAGFNPVIALKRETGTGNAIQAGNPVEPWQATFMARLINTAEAQYKFANGHYADYRTLLDSGQLKQTVQHEFTLSPGDLESEVDPLPGYRLRLSLAPDAAFYQLSIVEKTGNCGAGLFTDETGVILEGRAVGCATAPSKPGL